MPLITTRIVTRLFIRSSGYPPEGASDFYISLDDDYLRPYGIKVQDKLIGEILEIRSNGTIIEELRGKTITFIAGSVSGTLFISKEDFESTFREYGLVKGGFQLKLKFTKAIVDGNEVEIYTKRDVIV